MSVFIDESKEHLQLMNDSLLRLEQEPEDLKIIDEIFRSAHTLKGMSATMGFNRLAELTHHMENILDNIRNGKADVDTSLVDILFECLDTLNSLVDEVIEDGEESTEIETLMGKLEEISKGGTGAKVVKEEAPKVEAKDEEIKPEKTELALEFNEYEKELILVGQEKSMKTYLIEIMLDDGCLLKAARTYMVFRNLEEIGEIIKSDPSVQALEEEKFDNSFVVAFLTSKNAEEIKREIEDISEIKQVVVKDFVLEGESRERKEAKEAKSSPKSKPKEDKKVEKKTEAVKKTATVRVDTEKLDTLMNLVAELVINKTRLAQIGSEYNLQELSETLSHVDRVTSDLQAVVTKARMVPIETVFSRFPRMVRDLAKGLEKEINLVIQGKDTELDRTVIDEIGDPLVHLIRNSVDHGVEKPDVRSGKGKDPKGTILLKAEHEGNSVVITIKDDGKGIDAELMGRKAVEKGLLTEEEVEKLTKEEKIKLIFASGFSTAENITDVSGRGVGMDVVRTKIEALNGSIEVLSEIGVGSEIKIKLPLTLAIIEALMVKLESEIYAIPLANIVETIDIEKKDIKVVQGENVVLLRGEIVPILNLSKLLDVETEKPEIEDNNTVVVVKVGNKKIGLVVDVLIGQQEIVIKSLGKLFTGTKGITGATVLGNGEVALILDVLTLV
jgi:two-component system chemotaxis sensor kinase CheA